jgi:prefoldin subunit 5
MKKKLFPWIIALSALSVSGSAAFYSVSGLGKMFAGASTQVMVLAGSLELAKLVTASLLYEYWKQLNGFLKTYLSIATLILILITSAGIYGFLSSAYQETAFKVQNQDKNIEILDKNITVIQTEIKNYESQIGQKNNRLTQLTSIRTNLQTTQDVLIEKSKSTTAIRKQINDVDSEIKRMDSEVSVMNDSISSKNTKIGDIERNKLGIASNSDLAKEVGPLKYIADLTGKSLEQVVNWYIIVLMLVFDPLAIALVIAANFAFGMSKDKEEEEVKNKPKMKENKLKNLLKRISLKTLWSRIFKRQNRVEINNTPIINIEDPIDNEIIADEFVAKDIVLREDNSNLEEKGNTIIETKSITEPVSIIHTEENVEDSGNKVEDEDKYKDSNSLIDKQKMYRERFRNNPGSNPLKLR